MNRRRDGRESGNAASVLEIVGLSLLVVIAIVLPFVPAARGATTWNIDIGDNFFSPSSISVQVGDTVVWTNKGSLVHTVTSNDGTNELSSGNIASGGGVFSHTFNLQGPFTYRCVYHSMFGTVNSGTVIPEYSGLPFVMLGLMVIVLLVVATRRRI